VARGVADDLSAGALGEFAGTARLQGFRDQRSTNEPMCSTFRPDHSAYGFGLRRAVATQADGRTFVLQYFCRETLDAFFSSTLAICLKRERLRLPLPRNNYLPRSL